MKRWRIARWTYDELHVVTAKSYWTRRGALKDANYMNDVFARRVLLPFGNRPYFAVRQNVQGIAHTEKMK